MCNHTNIEIEKRFSGFMRAVVTRARADYLKKRFHREQHELPAGEFPCGADHGGLDIERMALRIALRGQPLIRQQILHLSFYCGYRAAEIAERLQCSIGFVNRQKQAAIAALRASMKGGQDDA